MSDTKTDQEPTMEEILASIRRIISEDGGDGEPREERAPAAGDDAQDVLELTEDMISDEQAPSEGAAGVEPASEPGSKPAPAPERAEEPAPTVAPAAAEEPDEAAARLVGQAAADRTSEAFAAFANAVNADRDVPLYGSNGRTLGELAEELLRPMLKDWLDRNLPQVVERLVQAEIARLSSRSDDR